MKKKNTLTIILLVLCVGLLCAGLILVKLPVAEVETPTENITLVDLGEGEITKLVITRPGGKQLVFLPSGSGEYLLEEFLDFEQDTLRIKTLISSVMNIQAKQLVEENSTRLAEFGITEDSASVLIQTEAGHDRALVLGNATPGADGYYAAFEDGKDVYMLSNTAVVHWMYEPLEFINRTLGEMTLLTEVTRAELTRKDLGTVCFERVSTPQGTLDSVGYKITEPEERAVDAEIFGMVINSASGLTAQSVATVNPSEIELKAVGLTEPYATFTMQTDGKTVVYKAGNEQNGFVYLMRDDVPVLYIAAVDTLPWYVVEYGQLISKELLTPEIEDLSKVILYDGQDEFEFTLSGTTRENIKITAEDKTLNAAMFLEYFDKTVEVAGEEYSANVPESFTGEPVWAVRYVYKNTDETAEEESYHRLRIFKGEDEKYYAYVDRNCDFTVSQKTANQLVANTRMLFELAGLVETVEDMEN